MTALTEVELLHLEGRVERWVRFGRHAGERILDRRRRILSFAPGAVFAFVRWAANDYGTAVSRIDVLRAVGPNEAFSTVPFVVPGGRDPAAHLRLAEGRASARRRRPGRGTRRRRRRRLPGPLATRPQPHLRRCKPASLRARPASGLGSAPEDRSMTFAWKTLLATLAATTTVALTAMAPAAPALVWNASASVPLGLYRVQPIAYLRVTDLVVVRPPEELARFLASNGYLPPGVPAAQADRRAVRAAGCVARGSRSRSTNVRFGEALEYDRRGRPLPVWQGCQVLGPAQVFLLNLDRPDSLDGRYFGPLSLASIVGRARPLWDGRGALKVPASLPFRPCFRRRNRRTAALAILGVLATGNATTLAASAPPTRVSSSEVSITVADLIQDASRRFAMPARWIAEVMQVESRGRAEVVSPKGAIGLMQVMPSTYATLAARFGLGADPWNPRDNVLAGAAYLREMYDRYGTTGMLAAYNAGPGRWEDHLSRKRPLPDETVRYIARLGPVVGGNVAPLPALDSRAVRPMPMIAPIFAILSGATVPAQSAAEKERIARIIVANAAVIGHSAALFVPRWLEADVSLSESRAGRRAADRRQSDRALSDAPLAVAPSSDLLFAPLTSAGKRP